MQSNVAILQGNISTINSEISALQSATTGSNVVAISGPSSGSIAGFPASNATITYSLTQGSNQRTGVIIASRSGTTVSSEEDYTQTALTDISFTITANSTYGILNYTTTTPTSLTYRIITQ